MWQVSWRALITGIVVSAIASWATTHLIGPGRWVYVAANVVGIATIVAAERVYRNSESGLGLKLGFRGFRGICWGTSIAEVVAKLGPSPGNPTVENGVTGLYYPRNRLFDESGADIYLFFDNKLIAGENISFGPRKDGYMRPFRKVEAAITKSLGWTSKHGLSVGPIKPAPDIAIWIVQRDFSGASPEVDPGTRYLLHRHPDSGGESMLALTVDDGRPDNECSRLARYVNMNVHTT